MMKNEMSFEKLVGGEVVRETEKAVLVKVQYGDVCKKDVWMPKSQVDVREDGVYASSWIINQKSERFGSEIVHIETESRKFAPNMNATAF